MEQFRAKGLVTGNTHLSRRWCVVKTVLLGGEYLGWFGGREDDDLLPGWLEC